MANAASDEPVHTARDGVTVEKTFEPDDFPVPAIAFTITSERDQAVSVRMADTIPDDIPTEDIGFHPKYGAEFWDVEGNTIVFTREFEPNEEYVTVYGLRGKDASDVERFLTEPEVTSVDEIEGASGNVVRNVIDDDSADSAEADDAAVDVTGSDTDSGGDGDLDIDLPDPDEESDGEPGTEVPSGPDEPTDTDEEGGSGRGGPAAPEPAVPQGESIAAALTAEIEAGEVDDENLAELREALGVTADDSTDARIEHLQSTVADLEAYSEALEAFLDEEGDAQSILEDVQADFETASQRIDDLEDEIEGLRDDVSEDLDEELADVRSEVEAMEQDLEDVTEERLDELEADLEALEAELADVAEMRDRLASALGGIAGSGTGVTSGSDHESDDGDDAADGDTDDEDDDIPDEPELDLED